jgi:type I restriction-modification system DNA methylase subunit/restriction endonuclease S subunit
MFSYAVPPPCQYENTINGNSVFSKSLIKKFADDSGHTAAEFYTNRTLVHLMTEMLEPQPGESIYDPTCGSGGMLLSCIAHLRRQNKEWRNVRLYGQERNLMTSAIARMNCFLHGIEDFHIVRGDTLAAPKFVEGDRLRRFDVVLANPPYSIKQWNRKAFTNDSWGRNLFGAPPQGRADYAFWQHIICSLAPRTGRCAILFPHGVLFRQEEAEMRTKLIEADLIECVLGLGPNLFYNSPMEACVVVCRTAKPKARKGKILFINAVHEVTRERAQSFLTDAHIQRILSVYQAFQDEPGFTRVATREEIRARNGNLSIPLYVSPAAQLETAAESSLGATLDGWLKARGAVADALRQVLPAEAIPVIDADWRGMNTCPLLKGKSSWEKVRFGDVVDNLNETCNPEAADLDRFIGMEHLEPGSLHVRTWGNVADGTTFTRRCRPGQVLFGKRRAYQRKVAVAEFDAVVSGDIYVLAPKGEHLLPELLPFLCLSERFFMYAVETSSGSLSPRTNWSHLAKFEFALPPLDQQRRLAEILWAVDEVVENWRGMKQKAEHAHTAQLKEMMLGASGGSEHRIRDIGDFSPPQGWTLRRAEELVASPITKGATPTGHLNTEKASVPFLKVYNLTFTGALDFSVEPTYVESQIHQTYLKRSQVRSGDILMNIVGPPLGKTALIPDGFPEGNVNQAIAIYRIEKAEMREFFLEYLRSDLAQKWLERRSKKTSGQQNLTLQIAQDLPVPIPPAEVISKVVNTAQSFSAIHRTVETMLMTASRLGQSIANQF